MTYELITYLWLTASALATLAILITLLACILNKFDNGEE